MEITRNMFWQQAAKGGTIIGLVTVGLSLLKYAIGVAEVKFLGGLVGFVSVVVFVMLIYGFTKKISASADPSTGFSFGRCVGFTVAMMLFVGFLQGTYSVVMNNWINPEGVKESIDATMLLMQDMMPDEQFQSTYDMMHKAMFSPGYLIFAGIFGYVIYGTIIGLITSVFAKNEPNIFASEEENEE